ncbi:Tryptophan synthasebeta chain [Penicillium lividum]|nr:Tryptophan synthasebeta chain [Penicillium lividum]
MFQTLRYVCFSSRHSSEADSDDVRIPRLRSISKASYYARVPRQVLQKTLSRENSISRRPPATDVSTCSSSFVSDAESHVTASSATSENPSSSPEALAKLPASASTIPSLDRGTPYVSILQTDGTLGPPPITFDGYGPFGGRFVPESLIDFLNNLTSFFEATVSDPSFWSEYATYQRTEPTPLQIASKLTSWAGGATIWLKREDQNEYGSHKTRNIIGQLLLARRMGFTEIVTDCAAAKHGNFTAAMCARLGLRCVIVMGAADVLAQNEDVLEMKMLGAKVLTARTPSGMGSLRAAITEALRYSVCNHESAYYLMGGPVGPNPLPTLTRTFQALLGEEVAAQMHEAAGRQPDAVVTAVGSGSGAVGMFRPFLQNPAVRLVGVEAAGAAALTEGEVGVLQGARTLMLQTYDGQILDSHSISPDLNLSTVGPEVAHWKECGRVEIKTATDADALDGFKTIRYHEGILAGLDSSHAVGTAIELARELGPGKNVVLLVTGCDAFGLGLNG